MIRQTRDNDLSVGSVTRLFRRHIALVSGWVTAVLTLSVIVISSLSPQFRAEATLILDTRIQHVSDLRSVVSNPFTTQDVAPIVRSEVQLLSSPHLAGRVVDVLNLTDDPAFDPKPSTSSLLFSSGVQELRTLCSKLLLSCLPSPTKAVDRPAIRQAVIDRYMKKLSVINDGRSFILSLSFDDNNPDLAAKIVNTHADLYLGEQRSFKRETAERGVLWVNEQIARLSKQLGSREQNLLALRESAGLIKAQGTTVIDQQVAQVGSQLAQARSELALREANRIETQGAAKRGASATQSDVLSSPVIQRLREQESVAQQALMGLTRRYDGSYPDVQQAKLRLESIERAISAETQRISIASTSDAAAARQRVTELEDTLTRLRQQLSVQENVSAKVVELERDIAALRVVYQGLLGRKQELEAQVGTEDADARLVSTASVPQSPFFPNKAVLLGFATIFALTSGMALAFVVDKPIRGFELPSDFEAELGLLALHSLPLVQTPRRSRRSIPDYLLDAPKAEFAEAVRSLRGNIAAVNRRSIAQVVAVTSALPREGKTTIALSLARSMAASGLNVLLIDCDLRRPRIGQMVGSKADSGGLLSVLRGASSLEEAAVTDKRSDLNVLTVDHPASAPQDILSSLKFSKLLTVARSSYEYIILDTPPYGAVSDSLLICEQADTTVIVVRWKETPISIVKGMLSTFEKRNIPLTGVILNAVDFNSVIKKDDDLRIAYRSAFDYYVKS